MRLVVATILAAALLTACSGSEKAEDRPSDGASTAAQGELGQR